MSDLLPPRAPRRPHELTAHGDRRTDDWYWLRDSDDPDVRAYLEGENAYTRSALEPLDGLRKLLYDEIVERVQETDESAPVRRGAWDYFTRTVEGLQYAIHGRRPAGGSGGPTDVVLLDENALAAGHDYFALGGFSISPDDQVLAYATDTTGGERLTVRFRDLGSPGGGADLPDVITDTYYSLAWANDSRTILYVRPDDQMRPWQVWRHRLGAEAAADELVFQEDDEHFFVSVASTRSRALLVVTSESKTTSEVHLLDADSPRGELRVVEPRRSGVEYSVEHHPAAIDGRTLLVLTNDQAENFRLVAASLDAPGAATWSEVVPHRPDVRLEDVDAFAGHLVLSERTAGLERLRVLGDDEHVVELPDPVYSIGVGPNLEYERSVLRYEYASLVVPPSSYDYDVERREARLVKRQPVLGGYDPAAYTSERAWATAPDGTRVPISVVRRADVPLDGTAPLLLYGYGAYEISIDPVFSSSRVSLLQRGCAFAIAHVRGGGELGRAWYDAGRLRAKPNTFTDFIACAQHLVDLGYTDASRLVARGGSAGGLLMGAVANQAPQAFRAVVAEVPFVDCLTTMLDDSLPLTITEWEEWGNPVADRELYELMKSYSPYDNVTSQAYPALFVTAGLTDPRVGFWEPAKWVAKLRATKSDDNVLVLKTEMGAGHHGPSGRYAAWHDEALVLAFVLDQVGLGPES